MNKKSAFDIDLTNGVFFEKKIENIFQNKKIEIKTEGIGSTDKPKWYDTKNIAIELTCDNKNSGLWITDADYWFHNYVRDNELKFIIAFPVKQLRKIVDYCIENHIGVLKSGGDGNRAKIYLIPLHQLFDCFFEVVGGDPLISCGDVKKEGYYEL